MKRMILPLFLLVAMALYLTVHDDSQEGDLHADSGLWMGSERYRAETRGEPSEPLPAVGWQME